MPGYLAGTLSSRPPVLHLGCTLDSLGELLENSKPQAPSRTNNVRIAEGRALVLIFFKNSLEHSNVHPGLRIPAIGSRE